MNNVNLPDSLLSRFDLLFIVLDTVDPEIVSSRAGGVCAGAQLERLRTGS